MDSYRRSIAKAVTYRIVGFAVTAGVAYLLTGEASLAAAVGSADSVLKIACFVLHERAWNRVKFGRAEHTDLSQTRIGGSANAYEVILREPGYPR